MLEIVRNAAGAKSPGYPQRYKKLWKFPEACYGYFLNQEDSLMLAKIAVAEMQVTSLIVKALGGKLAYRYNEAIADGFLDCAPSTAKGGARTLGYIDIVGAAIFFRCLAMGLPSRFAGKYTCLAVNVMREHAQQDGTPSIFKVAIACNNGAEPSAWGIARAKDLAEIKNEAVLTFDLTAIGETVKLALEEVQ